LASTRVEARDSQRARRSRIRHDRLLAERGRVRTARASGARRRVELQRLPDVPEELERLIAAERQCCPSIEMGVKMSEGAVVLTVTAPAAVAAILEQLFAGAVG
jgi:hypothetical protein